MLNLYCVFHLNLAYSSIEEWQRKQIIERCYWPLLRMIKDLDMPIAIEAPGYTLETIVQEDPRWIEELRDSLNVGEFVGSGYAQIIGPLIPAEVNRWNQHIGMQTYADILGIRPQVALVNEMAYSGGMVEMYQECGYRAVMMEWNNPRKYHTEWEEHWRYFPQRAVGTNDSEIPIIWADSIAFQKFQRYVHGELSLAEYITYLQTRAQIHDGYFPLYTNDVEIFDFRPGRYRTEATQGDNREWDRIAEFFKALKRYPEFRIVSPSTVLEGLADGRAGHRLHLESPEQPIPVKKQEKYNINRWALTGRDDLGCNTACYQIYGGMRSANPTADDWKELCYLWSSDFRTHITAERWTAYQQRLQAAWRKWHHEPCVITQGHHPVSAPFKTDALFITEDARYLSIETKKLACILDKYKGLVFKSLVFKDVCAEPLIGTLPHGYYEDISWAADFFSGHTIIETPGEHKITDLGRCDTDIAICGETLILNTRQENNGIRFIKTIAINPSDGLIVLELDVHLPTRMLATIHMLNMTLIPTSFDQASVFFATHLGGNALETFRIGSAEIHHARGLSSLVSAKHGLGTTEGQIVIGDAHKRLIFRHDQSRSALIAHVHFSPVEDHQYFLRLQYSAQEMDETFRDAPDPCRIRARVVIDAQRQPSTMIR